MVAHCIIMVEFLLFYDFKDYIMLQAPDDKF